MNPRETTIIILTTLSVSIALAADFKTIKGKDYKKATVSHIAADSVFRNDESFPVIFDSFITRSFGQFFVHGHSFVCSEDMTLLPAQSKAG